MLAGFRPGLIPGRHVRVFPVEEVERRAAEADPREAGLSRDDVDAVWGSVVRLYGTGLHPAIALCLRRRGRVVIDRSLGHLRGNSPGDPPEAPKVVATPDALFNLFSASKAVTAMVLHLLDERRLVHLDDPVAEYIPEFARHGKDWITLRHVVTHRAGIPTVPDSPVDPDLLSDHEKIVAILCDARPAFPAGRRLAYHALTGGYILGEVVRRVTGLDIRAFLRREVLEPLGLRTFSYGVGDADFERLARNAFTGPPAVFPFSWLLRRALGIGIRDAVEISNDPRFLRAVVPAGNIIGTANEASLFYHLLLAGGEAAGVRVFDRRTVKRAVAEQSYLAFDFTLCLPVSYGMGFMLGHEWASLYGRRSPRAFGHIGFTNVITWADPDRDIAAALLTSGKPFVTPELLYWYDVSRVIANRCPRDRAP